MMSKGMALAICINIALAGLNVALALGFSAKAIADAIDRMRLNR